MQIDDSLSVPLAASEFPGALAIVVFDIDGVVRDVGGSYRRALADTVEEFTQQAYRPSPEDIDALKAEGVWNNDWEASQELIYRYFANQGQERSQVVVDYEQLVAFFQSRYRGPNPDHWTGYICQEPLLMSSNYLEQLSQAGVPWGFFSGATRASATYVLERRLGLSAPVLVAMEDAPGKPDPTGLFEAVRRLEESHSLSFLEQAPEAKPLSLPVIYVGDTVADMHTVAAARSHQPDRPWIGVGILPPHVQSSARYAANYTYLLEQAGAQQVFAHVEQLTPAAIEQLLTRS